MTCKFCGNPVSAGETRCDFCGSLVPTESMEQGAPEENKREEGLPEDLFAMEMPETETTAEKEEAVSRSGEIDLFPEIPVTEGQVYEGTVSGERNSEKNRWMALFLAVIPYNVFGLYQFYRNGRSAGLLRLCTLNFVLVGYFMDIVDALRYCFFQGE